MKKKIASWLALLPFVGYPSVMRVTGAGFWLFRKSPRKSLIRAAAHFNSIGGQTIMEIGTGLHGGLSGNSMTIWPRHTEAKRIIAIDLDPARIDEIKPLAERYPQIETVLTDGIEYARGFDGQIDLLYLDFWVPDSEGDVPGTARAEAYLQAYNAAKDKMPQRAMILIDDTDHIAPWKHTLIIPAARKDGFKPVYTGRQTLLVR